MDFLKKLPNRIKSFFGNKEKRKYFIIISAAVIVLAAVPFIVHSQMSPPAFVGFNQSDRRLETLEVAVEGSDRLVKLTILREIPLEEYASIPGMFASVEDVPKDKDGRLPYNIEGYVYASVTAFSLDNKQMATLFDAEITYDYDSDQKVSEKIVINFTGTHQYQDEGNPIYQPGEQYVMMLEKMWSPDGPLYRTWSVFDFQDTGDGEFILKRFNAYDEIQGLPMSDTDKSRVTSTKENPVKNHQKIKVDDLVSAVKQKREELKNKDSNSNTQPATTPTELPIESQSPVTTPNKTENTTPSDSNSTTQPATTPTELPIASQSPVTTPNSLPIATSTNQEASE